MPMPEERKTYLRDYRTENVKRIPLDVQQDFYNRVKACAEAEGQSVNGLIKFLLEKYMKAKGF